MNKHIFLLIPSLFTTILLTAQVQNTSYTNQSNEKVLRLSVIVPVNRKSAWDLFTQDDKLIKWIAPKAHIELKTGGYILTNYDNNKDLSDSSSIRLSIISYLQNELLILRVKLNNNFPKNVQNEDVNLQEIIHLDSISPKKTKITSSMIGWGQGKDWENTYDFFEKGNIWTYDELLKLFN